MEDSIKVTEEELKQFADSIGAPYMLTSALNDTGIDQAFNKIIDNIEYFKNGVPGSLITTKKSMKKPKESNCKC